MTIKFNNCEICGSSNWKTTYSGKIRDGKFGNLLDDCIIGKCKTCKVERLAEKFCFDDSKYELHKYREKIGQKTNIDDYFKNHDIFTLFTQKSVWPMSLRNKIVMDVGCGGGSLLDNIKGFTKEQIAVEPFSKYQSSLASRGYKVFANLDLANQKYNKVIDIAFSIQVIEHVKNPLKFLKQIRKLLNSQGKLILSTPNREDILMHSSPEIYKSFFYRVVHRWYFDKTSLINCATRAGFNVEKFVFVHKYGMSNFINWLKANKPTGFEKLSYINDIVDSFWKKYLESEGKSDSLYIILSKN